MRQLYDGTLVLTTRLSPRRWLPAAFHVGDVEDAVRHVRVVPHVAELVRRVRGVRHGRDVVLHRGRVLPETLVMAERHPFEEPIVRVVDLDAPEERVGGAEPEAVTRVRELLVLRHEVDDVARFAVDLLVGRERGLGLVVVPLLDADDQLEVTVAQVGAEEVLVALRVTEAPYPPRRRRPEPLLVLLTARRDVEEAGPLGVGRRGELHEGAMLAARFGLLRNVDVAHPAERALLVALHGGGAASVAPRGEAVLLLRLVDHLAAGERVYRHGHEECDEGDRVLHGHGAYRVPPGTPSRGRWLARLHARAPGREPRAAVHATPACDEDRDRVRPHGALSVSRHSPNVLAAGEVKDRGDAGRASSRGWSASCNGYAARLALSAGPVRAGVR